MRRTVLLFAIIITIISFILWNGSKNSPQKTTNAFLENIQKGKWKSASSYIENLDAKEYFLEESQNKYNRVVFEKMEYKIGNKKKDDKQATIDVQLTTIDKRKALDKVIDIVRKEVLEEASVESRVVDSIPYLIKIAKSQSAEKVTIPVKLKLVKVGDQWKVDLTEEFMDALTGTYDRSTDTDMIFERTDSN